MRVLIFLGLLLLACGYALFRGGAPERTVAAAMLAAVMADLTLHSQFSTLFSRLDISVFVIDLVLLAIFAAVALNAERFWPIWLTAIQAVATLMHVARALRLEILAEAYGALVAFWAYPMVALLAIGTWRHRKRLKQYGAERSWSSSLPPWMTISHKGRPTP